MAESSNPFLKVYDGVYDLLFTGDGNLLAELIKVGNRVAVGTVDKDNRQWIKPVDVTSDVPELILMDEGGDLNPRSNSSGCTYNQSLTLICSTGDYRYAKYASVINWYILVNLQKWDTSLFGLTWCGESFLKNWKTVAVQIGESNPERNRGIKGWTIVWRMQYELFIAKPNLVYQEP